MLHGKPGRPASAGFFLFLLVLLACPSARAGTDIAVDKALVTIESTSAGLSRCSGASNCGREGERSLAAGDRELGAGPSSGSCGHRAFLGSLSRGARLGDEMDSRHQ